MKRWATIAVLLFAASAVAQNGPVTSYCQSAAAQANVTNILSTNYLEGVIPSCTVQVYLTGTFTPATIYSNAGGSALSNPFQANSDGTFTFWAAKSQGYDLVLSGGVYPNIYPNARTVSALYPAGQGSGTGTVTSFSAGNLSPFFTSSVATPNSTPALTFAAIAAAQNCIFGGPPTGGSGTPSCQLAPTFSIANVTNAPTWNQNTTGNAATATAFASSPSQCSGGQFVTGISSNGTPTCSTPTGSGTVSSASQWSPAFYAALGTTVSGTTPFTGLEYWPGSAAPVAASAAQVVAVIGSTAVANATNATSATTATTATNVASGTLGCLLYQSNVAVTACLAGNTAATDKVLVSHGTGSAAAAPTLSNAPALSATNMTSFPSTLATYPAAGVPLSTGSAWGSSYTVGTGASNLVQLNASSQLPAVSGVNLTAITLAQIGAGAAPTGTFDYSSSTQVKLPYNTTIGGTSAPGLLLAHFESATNLAANVSATAIAAGNWTSGTNTTPSTANYQICSEWKETQAASGGTPSSTAPTINVLFTSGIDSVTNVNVNISGAGYNSAGNSTTTAGGACGVYYIASGSTIQYKTSSYASSGTTAMQYAFRVRVYTAD